MCTPKGQPRKADTVFEFKFVDEGEAVHPESPSEWAKRLTDRLRGLMKEEISAHGGTQGYMKWVRSEDDDELDEL